MIIGQLGDEAAGDAAGPLAVDAAVGGVDYEALMARSCDSDIGEAAFFLEGRVAAFVERALRGEDAFLPAGEEDGAEFEALGGVDGHDGDLFLIARSEEHTSALQSAMCRPSAVLCLQN